MLALSTGWEPDRIGALPARFRAACHWALFSRAIVGNDGLPAVPELPVGGVDPKQRIAVAKMRGALDDVRTILFPEDADGDQ